MKQVSEWPNNLYYAVFYDTERPLGDGLMERVEEVLAMLEITEAEILRMRFRNRQTRPSIGRELDKTAEQVRRLEAKALRKLRHPKRARILDPGLRASAMERMAGKEQQP